MPKISRPYIVEILLLKRNSLKFITGNSNDKYFVYTGNMSQHEFYHKNWPELISTVVGWDPALGTYYAQIRDYKRGSDDDCVILWITPKPEEITSVMGLIRRLRKETSNLPKVKIPWRIKLALIADKIREGSATK